MMANSVSPKYHVKYMSEINGDKKHWNDSLSVQTKHSIKILVGALGNKNGQLLTDGVTSLAECQNRSMELSFHNS